jgi:hypothetical protein
VTSWNQPIVLAPDDHRWNVGSKVELVSRRHSLPFQIDDAPYGVEKSTTGIGFLK